MKRSLRLTRETLIELTADDLTAVVGAEATGGCPRSLRIKECLTTSPTCWTE